MQLTYNFVVKKFEELKGFVQNCENAIDSTQNDYFNKKKEAENRWNSEANRMKIQFEADKKAMVRKAENMLEDALQISGEIAQIEQTLLIKDKYYKKTKIKKESELSSRRNDGYDSGNDYFKILDDIRSDFERISRKYREHILPGIINGIHYFFSSKRKADYEELIVLQNTVKDFISIIRDNINNIRDEAIKQIESEYKKNYKNAQIRSQNKLEVLQSEYVNNITELTEVIGSTLDVVFPDELVNEMDTLIAEYQDSLNRVFDKKMGSSSFLTLMCIYLTMEEINASGPVYEFIVEKLKKLILNTEAGDYLLMPALGYTDENSNWYLKWDNNNRDFVQQVVCDLMYSTIARVPVGHLSFDIVDPISRGTSIRSYYDARTKIPELFSERIFINASDIDNHLNSINNYIDYVMQRTLGTRYNSVFEYADENKDYIVDVKYLIIFDFPKGMSEGSLEMISNIVDQGPKCGVFTIISETYDEMDVRRSSLFIKNSNLIKSKCQYVKIIGQRTSVQGHTVAILAQMPDRVSFSNYIDRYLLIRESIKNRGLVFPNMIKPLLLSDKLEEVANQIETITAFDNTMDEHNCFNVDDDLTIPTMIGLGTVQYPLNLFEDSCGYRLISQRFAKYSNFATMPFSIDLDDDLNILLLSKDGMYTKCVDFSHNILWSFFSAIPASLFRTCIIDIEGHGKNTIPFIDFCSKRPDIFYDGVISTHEKSREQLKSLVKHIDDISFKRLGSKYQNIHEYNNNAHFGLEPLTLLVIYDFSTALDMTELAELQKILQNGNRCGIYTVLCGAEIQESEKRDTTKVSMIESLKKSCTIFEPVEDFFKLTPFNVMLQPRKQLRYFQTSDFVERYIQALEVVDERKKNKAPENDYTVLFDLSKPPVYKRGNKLLHLPYGINAEGEIYYCDFEKDNFAAYLCGSSGSGKSTLIHALITGILMNNHPDDVELWLADFKMKEFRRYVKNRPPHIKYILLEESQDAVYDFLDRMQEKLSERERLSNAYNDMAKTPISQYMPLIFVIIDEFSIMSQIIDQNEKYKLILQNLLAKGRALGFRFLFSSQTFTTGVTGLSQTAKKQIQMRLAMKNPQEEITETIDMSKSLMTDEQKRWLLTLPRYYILLKKLVGEGSTVTGGKVQDEIVLTRAKGLYFPDEEYTDQNKYIQMILDIYSPVDKYQPSEVYCYKDKKSVAVDGSVYYSFADAESDIEERLEYIEQHDSYASETIRLFVGRPRNMQKVSEIVVDNEFEENLILFGTNTELCTSVLLSAMASLGYVGATVSVIGYSKNRVYRRINETGERYIDENYDTEEDICKLIHDLRTAIDDGTTDNIFLFIMGLDVLLKNISFMAKSKRKQKSRNNSFGLDFDESLVFGDDEEDISFEEKLLAEEAMYGIEKNSNNVLQADYSDTPKMQKDVEVEKVGIYDIWNDLEVILREGPRFGYHVFTYFRTYDEFKQTKYHLELFKHKITFQCSQDDSRDIMSKSTAFNLGEIAFLYTDMKTIFSMRPYLHEGLQWDGWETDDFGHARRMLSDGGE